MLNYQRVDLVTQGFFHPKDLNTVNLELVGGIPTPLKNMKVNWDDDIPNIWKVIKFMFQTTNQLWIIYGFHMISSMM